MEAHQKYSQAKWAKIMLLLHKRGKRNNPYYNNQNHEWRLGFCRVLGRLYYRESLEGRLVLIQAHNTDTLHYGEHTEAGWY